MRILPPLPNNEELDITRDDINRLLFESYKKCSNSGEEVAVLREMAKINGYYDKEKTTQVNILNIQQKVEQLEVMSDAQLLEMVGSAGDMFELPPPIDVVPRDSDDAQDSKSGDT